MAVPPHDAKPLLRAELKNRRDRFVSALYFPSRRAHEARLAGTAASLVNGGVAACTLPIGSEIDTAGLIDALVAKGIAIALPHVTRAPGSLRFLAWMPGTPLEKGIFGLRQPPADAPEVVPDVIFAPLLGFDAALNRIGYGAGHYDRAFVRHPDARRIGLAWSIQRCDRLPIDPWDIPLQAIVTETELIQK